MPMILDAVSPIEKLQLTGKLTKAVTALAAEKAKDAPSKITVLRLSAEVTDLLNKLGAHAPAEEATSEDELSDDPNSPNYRYRDTGYIADSRKERASSMIRIAREKGQALKATDIDWKAIEQNPRQAAELITKSNLFGVTDWDALRGSGMEPGAGFLVDRVYAAIGPQPAENTPQSRADYALALQTIRERLERCKTPQDVTDVLADIRDELTGSQLDSHEAEQYTAIQEQIDAIQERYGKLRKEREALAGVAMRLNQQINVLKWDQDKRLRRKWKPDPEIDAQIAALEPDRDAAVQAVADWEAANPDFVERWETTKDENGSSGTLRSGLRSQISALITQRDAITQAARSRNIVQNPITRGWLTFGKRFFDLLNWRSYKGSDAFKGHVTSAKTGKVTDWSWAESERPTTVKRATKKEVTFQLKVAERFERIGGTPVKVESTKALERMLGLSAVQSGNWVLKDPNSAKFHVEQTAAAMLDMSDVLGISPEALGLGGRLGIAFGARGTGAKGWKDSAPQAHYESIHRVINLTKMGGGGSLGHEWGHALDDLLAELATQTPNQTKDNFGSDSPNVLPEGALRDAMRDLRSIFLTGSRRLGEGIKVTDKDRKTAKYNIDQAFNEIGRKIKAAGNLEAAILAVDAYFERYTDPRSMKRRKQWRTLAAAYYAPEGKESVYSRTGPAVSNFLAEAVFIDGGERNKYWSRMHEMFARAFQSYLEDRLAGQNRKNDYLSVYADNKYHVDPLLGIEWKPYPEGEERTRINAAFDRLFEVIRGEQIFEKAMANKPLMDAIFGEMVDD